MVIVLKFEEMCQEATKEFSPLFSKVTPILLQVAFVHFPFLISQVQLTNWASTTHLQ
jgi:hypothetical protein